MVDLDGSFTYSKVVLIKEESLQNALLLYPNPAKQVVNVFHEKFGRNSEIVVTDLSGRLIMRRAVNVGASQTALNIGGLKPGLYLITLNDGLNKETIKFLKE
jgi:hypothetical protein